MKNLIIGTALAAVISTPAWAQVQADAGDSVLFESDVVIASATRIGVLDRNDVTVPASILTEADIAARGQQYVSDLLRALPGIAVSQSGSGGGLTQIRVRGAEANQVLILIDGIEVANPSTGEFDLSGLRAQDIIKIEVLRGEQSALYGSDAIGGVISIITRAGETAPQWRASFEGGSRGTGQGQVNAVIPVGAAALSVNGTLFTTEGYDVSGLGGEKDGSNSRALNIGLNAVDIGPVRFDVKYEYSQLDTQFDSDSPFDGRLDDTNDETERTRRAVRLDARFATGAINHKISGSFNKTDTDTVGGFSTRSIGERTNVSWVAGIDTGVHALTVLGELERETYTIEPNAIEADAKPENDMAAIAADYRFTQGEVVLSASARHDINDLFNDATTWRLGAGYGFSWDGRVRASVGTGVKNPSLIELFGFYPGSNFTGNPDLKPETSIGASIGYEQTIGNFHGSVDVFYSELEDEIVTQFLPPTYAQTVSNLDTRSTRQGVELEASYTIGNIAINGAATFLQSEQNDIEEIRRPDVTASASVSWNATDALQLSAQVDHTGSQLDTDFATFSDVTLDAFTLVGARAQYAINDHVSVSLRGENLLDEDYQEIVGFASPGRGAYAGLSLDF
ncbi:TonB-dependent receptor [Algimonas arctica]|uniref:TonB-dependent receptor n=1 Tax=Algimonas arctica TaxID=1479486 RepID=A0A8J3CQ96_9PROT|nr:TonB-dependent receptor [Algimonas arctica]GHA95073.1 TonB-dependent receptor [Algimonas arctica]